MRTPIRTLTSRVVNSSPDELRRSLNTFLVRTALPDLPASSAAEITLGEIFGEFDVVSYVILLVSLGGAIVIACWCGYLFLQLRPHRSNIAWLGAIPGVGAAVVIWIALFRFKHWMSKGKQSSE